MPRFCPLLAFSILAFALAQCASAPMSEVDVPELVALAVEPAADPHFQRGLAALQKADEAGGGWIWNDSDSQHWVLLGVALTDARRRQEEIWFVRLSVPHVQDQRALEAGVGPSEFEPTDPRTIDVRVPTAIGPYKRREKLDVPAMLLVVESFDRYGKPLQTHPRYMPTLDVGIGLASLGLVLAEDASDDLDSATALGTVKLMNSMHRLSRTRPIKPIRDAARKVVFREPGMLAMALSVFNITVQADFSNAQTVDTHILRLPPALADAEITMASSPLHVAGWHVLNARVMLGPMDGPLMLTGGMLGMDITHPTHTQNTLKVRLLATNSDAKSP